MKNHSKFLDRNKDKCYIFEKSYCTVSNREIVVAIGQYKRKISILELMFLLFIGLTQTSAWNRKLITQLN